MNYKSLLKRAVDLHMHIGPEIIPRKYTVSELIAAESGKLKGIGIKNHFFPTTAMMPNNIQNKNFIINSVVLNKFVGGFNSDIIRASAQLNSQPIIVWFPTMHAKNALRQQKYEIPPEWIDAQTRKTFKATTAKNISGLTVIGNEGKLKKEVLQVLRTIKDNDAILATGHLSPKETELLVSDATKKFKINKIIITHPLYQKIDMSLAMQQKLATMGAYIEHSFSMYSIDGISIAKIAKQIKAVGAKYCILTSDVGQSFSESPSQALQKFASMLSKQGISDKELKCMLVINPNKLISKNAY